MEVLYHLYGGLGGSFGGPNFLSADSFSSQKDAVDAAYDLAVEEYQNYEGLYGLVSEEQVKDQYLEDNDLTEEDLTDSDYEDIHLAYLEEVEGWISYFAIEASKDPNKDMTEVEYYAKYA